MSGGGGSGGGSKGGGATGVPSLTDASGLPPGYRTLTSGMGGAGAMTDGSGSRTAVPSGPTSAFTQTLGGITAGSGGGSASPANPADRFNQLLGGIPSNSAGAGQGAPSPASGQTTGTPNMFQAASQGIYDAMDSARDIMGYQPMDVSATRYDPRLIDSRQFNLGFDNVSAERINSPEMQAAQTTQADIERFYNPYTTEVVDQSMADIERNRLMQSNQAAAQAQAAGAFGGSRGALMEAEIARNALDQSARTGGDLRRQGFTTAAQLAQQDVTRRQQAGQLNAQQALQAALANQSTGLQAGMANQQAGLTAGQANMTARLNAALANQGSVNDARNTFRQQELDAALANQAAGLQGAGMRLGAGSQLASLGNLGFNQAQSSLQNMQQQGLLQQMLQQQIVDAGRGQFNQYQGQPGTALGYLAQALGVTQAPQSSNTTSDPGAFGWMSMLLSDVRLKKNIRKVGKTPGGHNLYAWEWKKQAKFVTGKTGSDMGVLAQEVMETRPDLVIEFPDGYYRVNYGGIS